MRRAPKHLDLFDRVLLDYAHNLLALQLWKGSHGLEDNPLVLKLLKLRVRPKNVDAQVRSYTARASLRPIRPPKEPMAGNLRRLRELLKLDDIDLAVFQLGLAISDHTPLREIAVCGARRVSSTSASRIIAAVLGHPVSDVAFAIGPRGRLVRCGLIHLCMQGDLEDRLRPKDGLLELLSTTELTREKLLEQFLPNVTADEPRWLDHRHLEKDIAITRGLLAAALANRAKGVNILLYGDTGTGKTELAKALARELGVPLYAARAGTAEGDDGPIKPAERISSLMLGLRIVESGGAMVLFDELEDLFERSLASLVFGKIGAITAKDSFNRLFEDNPAPVIWTTNHVWCVDPAFLRRFSHAIAVRPGGSRQRARVLKHCLGLADAPHAEIDGLAERYEVSPAQIATAARAAHLVGGTPTSHLGPLLEASWRLVTGRRVLASSNTNETYVADAINASVDLDSLAERLSSWKPSSSPGMAICLYGPPGTGKSEYVRYLARRLGRRVVMKRASDILSSWVGLTEQKIAEAFEEASIDDAILVFDEVDSLLQDRRDAQRSWEVTQVNEMLQQLEAFPGLVACTTNRWDALDPAVVRRFTFKIELKVPNVDQAARLFWAMFEPRIVELRTSITEHRVRHAFAMWRPTPGDLAAVRRRVSLDGRLELEPLLAEISAELRARQVSRPPGFLRR